MKTRTLSPELLRQMDAYWPATNYLSVGQIYLYDNPLLKRSTDPRIEVLAQRDACQVRGIALTPTQGLAHGMRVEDTGGPLKAPVGNGVLSHMFNVFGNVIDR